MPGKEDILRVGLFLMECVFEDSHSTSKLCKVHRVIVFCEVAFMVSLAAMNLLHARNEYFLRTIETFITEYHLFAKYTLYILNKDIIRQFLDYLDQRWSLDIAESELREEIDTIYRWMGNFLHMLTIVAFSTVFTFFLQPIYNPSPMIMEIWLPTDHPLFTSAVFVMECHTLVVALLVIIGTDSIFVSLCTHLYIELQLLQQEYGKLLLPTYCTAEEEREARRKFKACIEHHEFILNIFRDMRRVYSPLFLAQFFSTLISTCMELFILSINSESIDVAEVLNKFLYVMTIQLQFGMYCFPAEYLTEELKKVSDAVYNAKWYECKPNFRKELTIIMAASQKQSAFTAGGFSDVRMSTFTSVFKLSFSFYTVARNMFEKEARE